ncbi:hypothetical protein DMC30DRAFT_398362 [Rhodotorula diobovata]|uniref:Uncharacterized protein n=1 Tax=Rhodotorula diobovata TaxID=5288 RepID=A0A5C5FTJ3_9BASI|nr:hypothetical protein DMC30DRAFT_398362 [Rhodotorula diobovata]
MPVLDAYNYSLLSIPATFVIGMASHWRAIYLSSTSKDLPPFDNRAPRAFLAKIGELSKTSATAREYLRAEAAQTNVFEQIGLYAAAVLVGNFARLPVSFLNKATLAYVALRAVYCVSHPDPPSLAPSVSCANPLGFASAGCSPARLSRLCSS